MNTKICSKCDEKLPLTSEYFNKAKSNTDGFRGYCKKCEAKYKKQYRKDNKEKIAKDLRKYYEEHCEELKEYAKGYSKEYRANHKSKIKKYVEMNKGKTKEYKRMYYIKNKERITLANKENRKKYYPLNKDKVHGYTQKRRSLKRALVSTLTEKEWKAIKERFSNKCAYCGRELPLEQEHFIPLSKGGEYTINNIICACRSCNASKLDKDFFKWYSRYRYYSKKRERKILEFLKYKENTQQLSLIV